MQGLESSPVPELLRGPGSIWRVTERNASEGTVGAASPEARGMTCAVTMSSARPGQPHLPACARLCGPWFRRQCHGPWTLAALWPALEKPRTVLWTFAPERKVNRKKFKVLFQDRLSEILLLLLVRLSLTTGPSGSMPLRVLVISRK